MVNIGLHQYYNSEIQPHPQLIFHDIMWILLFPCILTMQVLKLVRIGIILAFRSQIRNYFFMLILFQIRPNCMPYQSLCL